MTDLTMMRYLLSAVVLSVALYIIVRAPEDGKVRDWAFGAVGLILGYWLR